MTRTQRIILVVATVYFTCTACMSSEQRYASWNAACRGDPGCIQTRAMAYEAQQDRSLAMTALGLQMMQASQPQPVARQRLTCSTQGIYTNCW